MAPSDFDLSFATFLRPSLAMNPFRAWRKQRTSPPPAWKNYNSITNNQRQQIGFFDPLDIHKIHDAHNVHDIHRASFASASSSGSAESRLSGSTFSSVSSYMTTPSRGASFDKSTPALPAEEARGTGAVDAYARAETAAALAGNSTETVNPDRDSRHWQRIIPDTLRCVQCSTDIAFAAQIVSKGFHGRHGRAYLVSAPAECADHLYASETPASGERDIARSQADEAKQNNGIFNIHVGRSEERQLATGAHVVADISCAVCYTTLGWKYMDARLPSQRYKIGKFILETARVVRHRSWEHGPPGIDLFSDEETVQDAVDDLEEDPETLPVTNGTAFSFGYEQGVLSDPVGTARALIAKQRAAMKQDLDEEEMDIEFDSDDEQECEEIFAGTWDPEIVARRRALKRAGLF